MKKSLKRIQTLMVAGTLLLGSILVEPVSVMAAEQTISIQVSYGQSEARKMLEDINAFRTSESDAWAFDEDGNKVEYTGIGTLSYDYELEKVAMQRAAEIAVSYSHTRPNGTRCFTAYPSGAGSKGENIAAGYTSGESVFYAWREDNEGYSNQGHRRNMLSDNYTAVGIGHVVYQGVDYWVQEFSSVQSQTGDSGAQDGDSVASVCVSDDYIESFGTTVKKISLEEGQTRNLSGLKLALSINGYWGMYRTLCVTCDGYDSSIANPQIATYENGVLKAVTAGKTALVVSAYGRSCEIPVVVTTKKSNSNQDVKKDETSEVVKPSDDDYDDDDYDDYDDDYDDDDYNDYDDNDDYNDDNDNGGNDTDQNQNPDQTTNETESTPNKSDNAQKNKATTKQLKASVSLVKKTKTLKKGKTYQIQFQKKLLKKYVHRIKYVSSNKKVASVTSKGKIVAGKKGTAVIKCTVYFKNGTSKTVKCTIKVK